MCISWLGNCTGIAETQAGFSWSAEALPDPYQGVDNFGISCAKASRRPPCDWAQPIQPTGRRHSVGDGAGPKRPYPCHPARRTAGSMPSRAPPPLHAWRMRWTTYYGTPIAETLSGTTWTASNLPVVSGQSVQDLTGISCLPLPPCVAVGEDQEGSSGGFSVAETLSGSTWTAIALPLPSGHNEDDLTGVSCWSTTGCEAVGTTIDGTPMSESLSGGSWTASNLPLPSGLTSTQMASISCPSSGVCAAVGSTGGSASTPVPRTSLVGRGLRHLGDSIRGYRGRSDRYLMYLNYPVHGHQQRRERLSRQLKPSCL